MKEEIAVKDVMQAFTEKFSLTHQQFADYVTDSLKNTEISRVSVTNWCNGKSSPDTDFLLICAVAYVDWRRTWAIECLKAKLPEVFAVGVVKFNLPKAE